MGTFETRVHSNREVAPGHYVLSLALPGGYPVPAPGQFVMVRLGVGSDPLLRRPFSIHQFHREKEGARLDILYRVVGRGTEMMSRLKRDAEVITSPPGGTGFHIPVNIKRICLVAGGVGVAPLVYLAQSFYRERGKGEIFSYVGAKTERDLLCLPELKRVSSRLTVGTEDGTAGFAGLVTEALKEDLEEVLTDQTAIYACGPRGMIRALAALLNQKPVFCQVSMEERMACGIGACLSCVVALKGREGNMYYGRVCVDGPVINIRHVIFEEER